MIAREAARRRIAIPGHFYGELSTENFGLAYGLYSIPFGPAKRWNVAAFGGTAVVDYPTLPCDTTLSPEREADRVGVEQESHVPLACEAVARVDAGFAREIGGACSISNRRGVDAGASSAWHRIDARVTVVSVVDAHRTSRRVVLRVAAAMIGSVVIAYSNAFATDMEGYSRPRQRFDNRGECCENAVYLAREQAARACEQTGGYAAVSRSAARGRCESSVGRDANGTPLYSCKASASVPCRNR